MEDLSEWLEGEGALSQPIKDNLELMVNMPQIGYCPIDTTVSQGPVTTIVVKRFNFAKIDIQDTQNTNLDVPLHLQLYRRMPNCLRPLHIIAQW